LATWALGIVVGAQGLQAGLVVNPDFSDYGVLGSPTAVNSLPAQGWSELGAGGANLVYHSFGSYSWGDDCVLLTTVGDGIRQKVLGTVAGQTYVIDAAYGQAQEWYQPTVRTSVFNGNSVAPADLITSYDYTLDADLYGDSVVSSSYVGSFVAQSSTTTLLITLVAKTDDNDPGAILESIDVTATSVPEPGTLGLLAVGIVTCFAWRGRRRGVHPA
jgi:hypothetical protein